MKVNNLIGLVLFFITLSTNAQSKNKNQESEFKVTGVCEMCKARIEEAALRTTGVKFAQWNQESQNIKLIYNQKKVTDKQIKQSIAKVGHDTEGFLADSLAYQLLPDCCKYKDGIKSH